MRKLPVGISDFKRVRDGGYYYVDKTDLISRVLDGRGRIRLYARPRGFGKTMNLSMLDAFLDIEYAGNSWFDGLRISEREDLAPWKNSFPVVHTDLRGLSVESEELFVMDLASKMSDLYRENIGIRDSLDELQGRVFDDILDGSADDALLRHSLECLTWMLHCHHGRRAVVLIDDYDDCLWDIEGSEDRGRILGFMDSLLGSLLRGNDNMEFGILAGTMRVTDGCPFKGLNGMTVDSMLSADRDHAFGFTPDEVRALCREGDHPEGIREAVEWYGGYRTDDSETLNPRSIMMYADSGFVPARYWDEPDRDTMIKDIMAGGDPTTYRMLERLGSGEAGCWCEDDPDAFRGREPSSVTMLMVQAGYFAENPNEGFRGLTIPNREIMDILASSMPIPAGTGIMEDVNGFAEAVLTNNARAMENTLHDLLSDILRIGAKDTERCIRAIIVALMLELAGRYRVTTDMGAGKGYRRIRMERMLGKTANVVIEIKRREEGDIPAAMMAGLAIKHIWDENRVRDLDGGTVLYGVAIDGGMPFILSERVRL